jgi:hypothetical protein
MPTAVEVPPDTAGAADSAGAAHAVDAAALTGAVDSAASTRATETTALTTNTVDPAASTRAADTTVPTANTAGRAAAETALSVAAATAAASAAVAASLPNNESTANFEILDIPTEQELLELEGGDTDVLDADDGADGANEEWESPGKRRRVGEHGVGVAAEEPTEKSSSSRKGKRGKKKTKRQEDVRSFVRGGLGMQNDASTSFLFSFIHEAVDRTAFELTSSAEYGYIFLYFSWAALVVGGGGDGCQAYSFCTYSHVESRPASSSGDIRWRRCKKGR